MRLGFLLVRESCSTRSRAGTAAFAQELSRLPVLHWPAILTSARKARSLATALDDRPARLFALSSGGLLLGVRAVLAQVYTGVTSVADLIVQYALYKGTGARNVLKFYRPVSVGSAIAGVEGGCSQRRLNDSARLAATLTPDLLAYRQGVEQPFVALAARAAATLCLVQYATVAMAKWDESDAYFCVLRGQTTQVMQLAAPAWDFGSWSVQFYGRQLICLLTSDRFRELVAPQEGHNQGCCMAGEGFNSTQVVVSAAMPKPDDVRIPSPRGPLPASEICFSDDRLFVRPSLQRAEDSISNCLSASRAMAPIPNMLKLEFFAFRMAEGEITAVPQTFELTGKLTDVGSPTIVGIPILHHVSPIKCLAKLLSKTRRGVEALQAGDPPPTPLLRLQSLHSFVVASVDLVLSGVTLCPVDLAALQARVNSAYRRALGAPKMDAS